MTEYSEYLEQGYASLKIQKNLPELFCRLENELETLPPELNDPALQKSVEEYFYDINTAIQKYNEQFQTILDELGVLCKTDGKQDQMVRFFEALLDLFRLAYTVYQDDPEKLKMFQPLLQTYVVFLKTKKLSLQKEANLPNALFVQMIKSAWVFTKSQTTMEMKAKQLGGMKRFRRQTRKRRV